MKRRVGRRWGWFPAGGVAVAGFFVGVLYAVQDRVIYRPQQAVLPIDSALPGARETTYSSPDGNELGGWYLEPSVAVDAGHGRPIVLFHGTNGTRSVLGPLAAGLAAHGHPVLIAEYRGFGGMAGKPSEAGLTTDAVAAVHHLAALTGRPIQELVIVGHSLGSAIALSAATHTDPAALALLAPLTSMPAVVSERLPVLPWGLLVRDRWDSASRIDQITVPLLIVGGAADKVIPPEHGAKLYDVANEPKQIVMIDGAGHDLFAPNGPRAATLITRFLLDQNL